MKQEEIRRQGMFEYEKLKLIKDLCYHLDTDVYFPVKLELVGKGVEHSLGFKKELFKSYIEKRVKEIKWK